MRLFVGVPIPEQVKEEIVKVQDKIKESDAELKLVERESLHFTVKFLGEVSEGKVSNVVDRLEKISNKRFLVKLNGVGVFPSKSFVRVVWVGIEENKSFVELVKEVQKELEDVRKEEYKEIVVHLTIARVRSKKNLKELVKVVEKFENIRFEDFVVDKFVLYESVLGKGGPVYKAVKEFELK